MQEEKFSIIEAYSREPKSTHSRPILLGLINCLSAPQVCQLLKRNLIDNLKLRDDALRKVCKDIEQSFEECHSDLIHYLIQNYDSFPARRRAGVSYCLYSIAEMSPFSTLFEITSFLIKSKYISNRRRAYWLIRHNESEQFDDLLSSALEDFSDPECVLALVDKVTPEFIYNRLSEFKELLAEPWQVARLYIKAAKVDEKVLDDLKKRDEITYAYVTAKLGLKVSETEAANMLKHNVNDERFGLLAWSIGQMQLWEVLFDISQKM